MAQGDGLLEAGVFKSGGSRYPGWFNNIGIQAAQTSVAADSIKITGADGSSLLTSNVGYFTIPNSTTSGLLSTLRLTADVTIDLTGAHWGFGTLGDLTDARLNVYAINDTEAIKFGVSFQGGLRSILNTDSSTTATNITAIGDMLVNSSLNSGTWPCIQIGWVNANFDDAGGSSADLWEVQTSVSDINLGLTNNEICYLFLRAPSGYGSTNNKIRTYATVEKSIGSAASIVQSASNGDHFLINSQGTYSISVSDQFSSASFLGLTLNSANLTTALDSLSAGSEIIIASETAAANVPACPSATIFLSPGDIVRPHFSGTASGTNTEFGQFILSRVG